MTSHADSGKAAAADRPALVWSGADPVIFGVVLAALQDAKITHHQLADHDQMRFLEASPGPRYGIFVPQHDAARAEKVIREAVPAEASE